MVTNGSTSQRDFSVYGRWKDVMKIAVLFEIKCTISVLDCTAPGDGCGNIPRNIVKNLPSQTIDSSTKLLV
jgi:hypothetical protein